MTEITQAMIDSLAPNAAASANGRKISLRGGFVRHMASEDGTFYMGECTGSGKSNYITSADFVIPGAPVFRCSCPSRQFPCKHSLGLLYDMMAGKSFEKCEIPEDILQKRAKKEAREAKKAESASEAGTEEPKGAKKPSKAATAAKAKKISRQIEGLDLTAKLVRDLMNGGLGTMGGTSLGTYQNLAKQLGDYYLPGPQRLLNGLILEIQAFQMDQKEEHYERAIDILERLWTLTKKARDYLRQKLDSGEVGSDESVLFEELGGVWRLDDLRGLGLQKENVCLMQLAFWVADDPARAAFVDTGVWVDLGSGEIGMKYNYRPYKALKHIAADDTDFSVRVIPSVAFYPGEGNRRMRWDASEMRKPELRDYEAVMAHASASLAAEVKGAKNLLKNTMAPAMLCRLLRFTKIGRIGEKLVIQDASGAVLPLGDMPGMEPTAFRLTMLPDPSLLSGKALLGAIWQDKAERQIRVQPLSIVTQSGVVRLLY